jgi:cytochrome c oxidase subunit 2
VVFVAINLFIAWAVIRYRQREGHRAAYEPHNRKLELWLTGITSAGIVAMLAPGLWAYADLIDAPKDAMVFEVVAQQWQWRYRFPGKDGRLGVTDVRFIAPDNPYGLNPDDPGGQDDILVDAPEVHVPIGKPIKVLQRSRDVLHDFYVPQIRVKMDIVPGVVSHFWFTATRTGKFDVMCAEYCGVAHFNMRGHFVVEPEQEFEAWLAKYPTFAEVRAKTALAPAGADGLIAQGRDLAQTRGCLACHTLDGKPGIGPTWKGLFGKTETLTTGATVKVDEDYVKQSIVEPNAAVVQGFQPVMPPASFSDQELSALVAFIKDVSAK